MKLFSFLISLGLFTNISFGQIAYFEDFGTGCTTGTLATTFGWTVTNTGLNQATANIWYVSANERGVGAGNCGIGCGGTESRTLHLGPAPAAGGDVGAAYLETDPFFCSFGFCAITDRRVESPTIDCSGISAIPLTFDYIENGEGTNDDCTVWYSANNGGTWTLLDNPPKTALCGGGQGLWATRNLVLPASANNNPTVKIGFRWVNNGNGVGTDPSFAVDNIQVGIPIALGVDMVDMIVGCDKGVRSVAWITQNEYNADYFNVYRSENTVDWELLQQVTANNQSSLHEYEVTDLRATNNTTMYYYIEQVDKDGMVNSYKLLSSQNCNEPGEIKIFPNPSDGNELTILSSKMNVDDVQIFSIEGKQVGAFRNHDQSKFLSISPHLSPGTYVVKVFSGIEIQSLQLIIY